MSTANKIDLKDFELVPANGAESFHQQLTKGRSAPIRVETFKALLLAAARCLEYAQKEGSELSKQRAKDNYNYYFNQIDMEDGDALSMFMYDSSDWEM